MIGTRIYDQRPSGGCNRCGGPVRTRKSNGWVCVQCERDLNRRWLTLNDIEDGYENPEWMGFGYLGARAHERRAAQDRADAAVLAQANRRNWSPKQLFQWLNSRDGRHFGDFAFGGGVSDEQVAEGAASFFRGW